MLLQVPHFAHRKQAQRNFVTCPRLELRLSNENLKNEHMGQILFLTNKNSIEVKISY